jgi:hypothetical protein
MNNPQRRNGMGMDHYLIGIINYSWGDLGAPPIAGLPITQAQVMIHLFRRGQDYDVYDFASTWLDRPKESLYGTDDGKYTLSPYECRELARHFTNLGLSDAAQAFLVAEGWLTAHENTRVEYFVTY